MKNANLVSVIVTCHNDKDHILRALYSLFNQTYNFIEIVVVDDGSSDGTSKFVKEEIYDRSDCIFVEKQNGGLGSARHFGAQKANGEYICFLDADDEYFPQKVEEQVAAFENLDNGLLFVGSEIREDNGRICQRHMSGNLEEITKDYVTGKNLPAANASMMVKAECYQKWGGFDPVMRRQCEEDFIFRVLQLGGKIYCLNKPLYIVNESSESNRWQHKGRVYFVDLLLGKAKKAAEYSSYQCKKNIETYSRTVTKKVALTSLRWPVKGKIELCKVFLKNLSLQNLIVSPAAIFITLFPFSIPVSAYRMAKSVKRKISKI